MNTELVQETPVLPTRTRKRATVRNYHCALHEAGASRLTDSELEIVTKALVILENKVLTQRKTFSSPSLFKAWATLQYGFLDREVFGLVFVDKRHRYIAHQQLFTGTLDGASVYPREILRSVLEYNAAAVMMVHVHPSGIAEPSQADELITQRIKEMLTLVDVRVLDHVIVAKTQIVSLAERGLI
jgi:DNA repair protein RadC